MRERKSRSAWMRPLALLLMLAACSSAPPRAPVPSPSGQTAPREPSFRLADADHANEIVMFALGLLDTGYQFGGRNPEAGLDCSGMVSYIVEKVAGRRLPHNAAQIAALTRPVERHELRPADLVFFNTNGKRYSHMGIYLGEGRFIHAPATKGKVRIERMDLAYFATRYDGARSLF